MPFDSHKDSAVADPLVSRPSRIPTPLMAAGVAGACVLGAGLGLWARPTNIDNGMPGDRPAAAAPARPAAPQQIEIRVDRPPTPAADLAPAAVPEAAPDPAPTAEAVQPAAPTPAPAPSAPKPAPEGLVKVRAVVPAKLAEEAPPKPIAEIRKASPAPVAAAAAGAARKKAEAARAREARREAEAARAAREEAEAAAARKRRQEKARLAAVEAEARERAETKAREKAERRLAEQKAAERLAEKKAAARLAERRAAERAEKAAAEKKRIQLAAQKAAKPAAPPVQTVKVVRAGPPRCASADPGAALACNDPSLGAADRRLARAYREAEEAGVPPERLERQQRRWLQARANAARQAPWAVHDIYLARIAELEDQAREAERQEY